MALPKGIQKAIKPGRSTKKRPKMTQKVTRSSTVTRRSY
jgi:hypothetical protein